MVAPLAAGVAVFIDRIVGEPPPSAHPVALFGHLMERIERALYADDRVNGILYVASGLAVTVATGAVARRALGRSASAVLAAELAIAGRMLATAAAQVNAALRAGDVAGSRALLPALVGRDPSELDEAGIARAVVESVAENTVDAVIAPVVWGTAFGAPGALGYRAVNTMDAMVGHHSARYEHFGWAAARADDVANWLPARLTALAVAAVRPCHARAVWQAVRADAPHHPSPNAGVAEAAFAAALRVQLGGTNRYGDRTEARALVGTGGPPTAADIEQAVRLARDVAALIGITLVAGGLISSRLLRRR